MRLFSNTVIIQPFNRLPTTAPEHPVQTKFLMFVPAQIDFPILRYLTISDRVSGPARYPIPPRADFHFTLIVARGLGTVDSLGIRMVD